MRRGVIGTTRENLSKRRAAIVWLLLLFPSFLLITSKLTAVWRFAVANNRIESESIARTTAQHTMERALDSLHGKTLEQIATTLNLQGLRYPQMQDTMPKDRASRRILDALSDTGGEAGKGLVEPSGIWRGNEITASIQDPLGGDTYCLYFSDGIFENYSRIVIAPPLALDTSPWDDFNAIRYILTHVAMAWWWIALCVMVVMWFGRRRKIGREAVLAISILYWLNALLSSANDTIMTDDAFDYRLYVGFVMVIVGMVLLAMHEQPKTARVATAPCRSCGYNLTGNLSGICPECGTPLPTRWWVAVAKAMAAPIDRVGPEARIGSSKNDRPS
jgi:hypothetical protein